MSIDGAHDGHSAGSAMHQVMGGRPEDEPAPATKEERRAEVEAAEWRGFTGQGAFDYDTSAKYAAKMILQGVTANPQIDWLNVPTEGRYEYLDGDGDVMKYDAPGAKFTMVEPGWSHLLEELWSDEQKAQWHELGLSGFQWGWAVNTVRWFLDMPPVGNPAIVTIGGDS